MPILMYLVGVITAYRLPELLLPTIIYLSMHQALVFYIKAEIIKETLIEKVNLHYIVLAVEILPQTW